MNFTLQERAACQTLVAMALAEDLGGIGDVTSQTVIPVQTTGRALLLARADGIIAGLPSLPMVLDGVDSALVCETFVEDGTPVYRGDKIGVLSGPMRSLLSAERTALNFLQHLSGVASLTRRYVDAVAGTRAQILDTRKTLPGWRLLQKYAVRCGGGTNHRVGLYDGLLVKDNHLATLARCGLSLRDMLQQRPTGLFLEIEVDTLEQLDMVLDCGPDMVLLDNMPPALLRQAVHLRDQRAPAVLLEASGGVNLDTVRGLAEAGVDRISVGALTHSAAALDISLDFFAD